MIDFMLSILSTVLHMEMRDHHDIPFALPLVMACMVAGLVGFTIVRFIGNEQQEDRRDTLE